MKLLEQFGLWAMCWDEADDTSRKHYFATACKELERLLGNQMPDTVRSLLRHIASIETPPEGPEHWASWRATSSQQAEAALDALLLIDGPVQQSGKETYRKKCACGHIWDAWALSESCPRCGPVEATESTSLQSSNLDQAARVYNRCADAYGVARAHCGALAEALAVLKLTESSSQKSSEDWFANGNERVAKALKEYATESPEAKRCGECGVGKPMHTVDSKRVCCACNVAGGGAPADWHPECMKAHEEKRRESTLIDRVLENCLKNLPPEKLTAWGVYEAIEQRREISVNRGHSSEEEQLGAAAFSGSGGSIPPVSTSLGEVEAESGNSASHSSATGPKGDNFASPAPQQPDYDRLERELPAFKVAAEQFTAERLEEISSQQPDDCREAMYDIRQVASLAGELSAENMDRALRQILQIANQALATPKREYGLEDKLCQAVGFIRALRRQPEFTEAFKRHVDKVLDEIDWAQDDDQGRKSPEEKL